MKYQAEFVIFEKAAFFLAIGHLNLKLLTLCRHTASYKILILKVQEILKF